MSLIDSVKNTWAIAAIVGSAGSTIVGGTVWVMSFAKTSDVQKSFERVNNKVDQINSRLDTHEALIRKIDEELNQLLIQTIRRSR